MEGPKKIYVYCGMSVYATERKSKDQTAYIRADLVKELLDSLKDERLKGLSPRTNDALAALKAVEGE